MSDITFVRRNDDGVLIFFCIYLGLANGNFLFSFIDWTGLREWFYCFSRHDGSRRGWASDTTQVLYGYTARQVCYACVCWRTAIVCGIIFECCCCNCSSKTADRMFEPAATVPWLLLPLSLLLLLLLLLPHVASEVENHYCTSLNNSLNRLYFTRIAHDFCWILKLISPNNPTNTVALFKVDRNAVYYPGWSVPIYCSSWIARR